MWKKDRNSYQKEHIQSLNNKLHISDNLTKISTTL